MLDGGSLLHDDSARTLETGIQARPGITVEMSTQTDDFEKVRSFQKKLFRGETRSLVLGSSIIAKLEIDKTIPIDCAVHPYRGSTTNAKLKVVSEYEDRKIDTLILQDGTKNVLKHHQKSAQDHFADHAKLVKECIEKFQPEVFVVSKVPPLKNLPQNMDKNNFIDEFNELIHSTYSYQIGFKILNVNKNIKEKETSIDQTDDNNVGYNYLFFGNVHLNHQFGVQLLKIGCYRICYLAQTLE